MNSTSKYRLLSVVTVLLAILAATISIPATQAQVLPVVGFEALNVTVLEPEGDGEEFTHWVNVVLDQPGSGTVTVYFETEAVTAE